MVTLQLEVPFSRHPVQMQGRCPNLLLLHGAGTTEEQITLVQPCKRIRLAIVAGEGELGWPRATPAIVAAPVVETFLTVVVAAATRVAAIALVAAEAAAKPIAAAAIRTAVRTHERPLFGFGN